jgi:hypothetical protein
VLLDECLREGIRQALRHESGSPSETADSPPCSPSKAAVPPGNRAYISNHRAHVVAGEADASPEMVLGTAAAHELEPKNPRRPTERVVIPTERSDEESLILPADGA